MRKAYPLLFLLFLVTTLMLNAQMIVPVAFDLATPIDVNLDAEARPIVTLGGTGANDGQVVRLEPDGTKTVLIHNLPSFFNFESNELQGALSTQVLSDGRIYVCQGGGPDSLSGSIIGFHLDDFAAAGTALTPADRRSIVRSGDWVLAQGYAETNPYSFIVEANDDLVIADAAANAIVRYTAASQEFSVIVDVPSFPNPSPIGPPFIQPVPTKILAHPEGGYLIGSLTGFPFLDGASSVYRLQTDGSLEVFATGLTLVTDLAFAPSDNSLLALQFAAFGPVDTTFSFQFGSAQVVRVGEMNQLDTLLSGFGPSPGMAIAADGTAYFTHLFLGQLLRTDNLTSVATLPELPSTLMEVFPNPNQGQFQVRLELSETELLEYKLYDMLGRSISSGPLGQWPGGAHQLKLDLEPDAATAGRYELVIYGEKQLFRAPLVVN